MLWKKEHERGEWLGKAMKKMDPKVEGGGTEVCRTDKNEKKKRKGFHNWKL